MVNELIILAVASLDNDQDQIFMADLYVNYINLMYRKALDYVGTEYDAEDITHNVYLNLIKKVSLLKTLERHTLVAYIVYSIKNASLNFIKNRDNNLNAIFLYSNDDTIDDVYDVYETPEEIILEKYENEKLHEALEQLNTKYKFILECKYFQNLSDREIAEILDITPDYVRKYLERARKSLRKILEREREL